jgi:hypothetical protein
VRQRLVWNPNVKNDRIYLSTSLHATLYILCTFSALFDDRPIDSEIVDGWTGRHVRFFGKQSVRQQFENRHVGRSGIQSHRVRPSYRLLINDFVAHLHILRELVIELRKPVSRSAFPNDHGACAEGD